jgi:hypothetical protein
MSISPSIAKLKQMSDEQLIEQHDLLAPNTGVGTQFYLDELNRRSQDRQTFAILRSTKIIERLTWVLMVLTVASIFLAIRSFRY